nr:unnamed protein product [Digitaria exilis]
MTGGDGALPTPLLPPPPRECFRRRPGKLCPELQWRSDPVSPSPDPKGTPPDLTSPRRYLLVALDGNDNWSWLACGPSQEQGTTMPRPPPHAAEVIHLLLSL